MFWFFPYKFDWKVQPNKAMELLKTTCQKTEWERLVSEFESNRVKIHHKLPVMFYNSWNPIFVGKFISTSTGSQLVGYFRVHWFTMIFMVLFLGMTIFNIFDTWLQPEIKPGYVANWKANQLEWELQFLAISLLIFIVGWLIGLINQMKILKAIRESINDI